MNMYLAIDLENHTSGFSPDRLRTMSLGEDIARLEEAVSGIAGTVGSCVVKRAYANFADPRMPQELTHELCSLGIEHVHVPPSNGIVTRNDSDFRMACDLLAALYGGHHLTAFLLLTGDGAFRWVVDKIRAAGRLAVAGSYSNQASKALRHRCDAFVLLDVGARPEVAVSARGSGHSPETINPDAVSIHALVASARETDELELLTDYAYVLSHVGLPIIDISAERDIQRLREMCMSKLREHFGQVEETVLERLLAATEARADCPRLQ